MPLCRMRMRRTRLHNVSAASFEFEAVVDRHEQVEKPPAWLHHHVEDIVELLRTNVLMVIHAVSFITSVVAIGCAERVVGRHEADHLVLQVQCVLAERGFVR